MKKDRVKSSGKKNLILVTGLSGAGKSTALHVLEDRGFFCIDNLPFNLLPSYLNQNLFKRRAPYQLAIDMDARDEGFLKEGVRFLSQLKKKFPSLKILYLTASEAILIRRFSETRRRHPLAPQGSLTKGIRQEKKRLKELQEISDQVIDTTYMNVHDLKKTIEQIACPRKNSSSLPINLLSFGYSYGIPPQCELVFDVRFLTNPYFIPEFKSLDGTNLKVRQFVLKKKETKDFIAHVKGLLGFLIPLYAQEGKSYLTIGFGCTGGKHRSVSLVEYFKDFFEKRGSAVTLDHRDIAKH